VVLDLSTFQGDREIGLGRSIAEYLRPDPEGHYVVPARNELLKLLGDLGKKFEVIELDSDTVILRTRSRSAAKKAVEVGLARGLLIS